VHDVTLVFRASKGWSLKTEAVALFDVCRRCTAHKVALLEVVLQETRAWDVGLAHFDLTMKVGDKPVAFASVPEFVLGGDAPLKRAEGALVAVSPLSHLGHTHRVLRTGQPLELASLHAPIEFALRPLDPEEQDEGGGLCAGDPRVDLKLRLVFATSSSTA
jgi:hypothetical protein